MLKYDGQFDISTGASRKEISWKQQKVKWSTFLNKISKPHRTHETYKEYRNLKPDEQDIIKDVGGFVGGLIAGGRRKKGAIVSRQLVTLDIDAGKIDFWKDWELLFEGTCAIYSTHKHSTASPRFRLIIPLSRPVMTDEYQAIARKLAAMTDIDMFDPTTFEPERMMYWPSASTDGEYIFQHQDGVWLNPDEILDLYSDWKDSSQWPVASAVNKRIETGIKKQGDPLEKEGIVGAFCRAFYPIETAIDEFLPEVYTPSFDGRYTFANGTAANGLVIYENKYCFSHHGTDPAGGKLCNAWDIVRIHKFGNKDDGEDLPINKRPSQIAMEEFAAANKAVRRLLGIERLRAVEDDFGITFASVPGKPSDDVSDKWLEALDTNRQGNPFPTIENILLILNNDPKLKDALALNDFSKRVLIKKPLPWRTPENVYDSNYTNTDDSNMRLYLEKHYRISNKANIQDALEICFKQHAFHPVRDYLKDLKWDNKERARYVLIDYLGAEDSAYTQEVTLKTLCGAVARIFKPGVKFDTALILIGDQGTGKSTLVNRLAGSWFSDSFGSLQNNRAYEQIQGVWIMEIGELAGLKKAEVDEIKLFISKQEDAFRPAYGHKVEVYPRQCIFIGTTNEREPLQDKTGNRRFWPVEIGIDEPGLSVFDDFTPDVVDQVWAEVYQIFSKSPDLHLSREMEGLAKEKQAEHTEPFLYAGSVEQYLERLYPENWELMGLAERRAYLDEGSDEDFLPVGTKRKNIVCIHELWCEAIGGKRTEINRYNSREINLFMRGLKNWKFVNSPKSFGIYGKQKYYKRLLRQQSQQ